MNRYALCRVELHVIVYYKYARKYVRRLFVTHVTVFYLVKISTSVLRNMQNVCMYYFISFLVRVSRSR